MSSYKEFSQQLKESLCHNPEIKPQSNQKALVSVKDNGTGVDIHLKNVWGSNDSHPGSQAVKFSELRIKTHNFTFHHRPLVDLTLVDLWPKLVRDYKQIITPGTDPAKVAVDLPLFVHHDIKAHNQGQSVPHVNHYQNQVRDDCLFFNMSPTKDPVKHVLDGHDFKFEITAPRKPETVLDSVSELVDVAAGLMHDVTVQFAYRPAIVK